MSECLEKRHVKELSEFIAECRRDYEKVGEWGESEV